MYVPHACCALIKYNPGPLAASQLAPARPSPCSLQIVLHKNLMRLRQFMAAPDMPIPDAPRDWMPPMPRPDTPPAEESDDDEVSVSETEIQPVLVYAVDVAEYAVAAAALGLGGSPSRIIPWTRFRKFNTSRLVLCNTFSRSGTLASSTGFARSGICSPFPSEPVPAASCAHRGWCGERLWRGHVSLIV